MRGIMHVAISLRLASASPCEVYERRFEASAMLVLHTRRASTWFFSVLVSGTSIIVAIKRWKRTAAQHAIQACEYRDDRRASHGFWGIVLRRLFHASDYAVIGTQPSDEHSSRRIFDANGR